MKVHIVSAQCGIRIGLEVAAITSDPGGTFYIDGYDPSGRLFTVQIGGTDLDGKTFREVLDDPIAVVLKSPEGSR